MENWKVYTVLPEAMDDWIVDWFRTFLPQLVLNSDLVWRVVTINPYVIMFVYHQIIITLAQDSDVI